MDDKTQFNTTIRMLGSWTQFGSAFVRLFAFYNWTRAMYLSDSVDGNDIIIIIMSLKYILAPDDVIGDLKRYMTW